MENFEINKINTLDSLNPTLQRIAEIEDMRQSEKWELYLSTLGWTSFRTSKNINLEIINIPFGKSAKVQRPMALDLEDLEEIMDLCKKNNVSSLKLEPNLKQNLELLTKHDFFPTKAFLSPPTTILIDLTQKENDLWNNISQSGKYSIRRAVREKTRTEIIRNPSVEKVIEFEKLQAASANRKRFTAQTLEDLKTKRNLFGDDLYLVNVFNQDNILCGGKMFFAYKNNVWYLHGGTSEEGTNNKSGYELLWQAIMYFKKKGFTYLDLEGKDDYRIGTTQTLWGGFSHFKEKFGGIVVEYPLPMSRFNSKALKFLAKYGFGNIL